MEEYHIVIVEDEGVVALQLKNLLEQRGFVVDALCSSGEDLLACLDTLKSHLIVMDIKLQGPLDGIQTAEIVRERKMIPIVYLTAFSDGPTVERAKLTSPYGFILKPLNTEELFATIRIALHRHAMDQKRDNLFQEIMAAREADESRAKNYAAELTEMKAAVRVLFSQMQEATREQEENILSNIKQHILPKLQALKMSELSDVQRSYLSSIESILQQIASGFVRRLASPYVGLTQKELEIALLIKEGKSTKDIMELLGVSKNTVDSHRNRIRAKLGIKKTGNNLRSYLLSLH
jgi:DNA-binding NarL/FixJ family response regulator